MKTLAILLTYSLFLLMMPACNGDGGPTGGGITIPELQIDIDQFKVQLDRNHPPSECTTPRPANIGCTTICKPCIIFICQNGEWVKHDASMPDELCDPPDVGTGGNDMFACPRGPNGFCPAECKFCY